MPQQLLFYWTNFAREWNEELFRFHAPSKLFEKARRDDVLWALTRRNRGDYVFVGRFVIERANPPVDHRFGRYSITCNRSRSVLLDSAGQQWTKAELRRLFGFRRSSTPLGQWFHGPNCVRPLPERTATLLEKEAARWPKLDGTADSPFGAIEQQKPPGIPAVDYDRVLREIAVRRGQANFRAALFGAFGARCAITGSKVSAVLEAAHIIRLSTRPNTEANGLLLRSDIHTLFDLFLVSIDPRSLRVWVAPSVRRAPYDKLHKVRARIPGSIRGRKFMGNLTRHYRQARARTTPAFEWQP